MASDLARFAFGASAASGVMFGVGWRQLPSLAAGAITAGVAIARLPADVGTLAAVGAVAAGGAAAFVPVAGHRIDQWVLLWAGWTIDRLRGRHRWRSHAPTRGHHRDGRLAHTPPPPALTGVALRAVEAAGGLQLGVVTDRRADACAAVIQLRGTSLLLASDAERAGRFAAWSSVLATLARAESPVARVQWSHRIAPDDGTDTTRWHTEHTTDAPDAATDSYQQLLDEYASGVRHEELVVVAVSAATAGIAGRRNRHARLEAAVAGEAARLASRLDAAGFAVDGILSPRLLVAAVRRGFDPFTPPPHALPDQVAVWPLATDATTTRYRCDGAWHATYWIEQWPAAPVAGEFLAPLIVDCRATRTLSITATPVDPVRARRDVERDLVATGADDDLRTRLGFRTTAHRHAETATAQRREAQLAAGHGEYQVVGLITISGRDRDELAAACGQVEQLAAQCHLGIRRLWGRQPEGHAATLPLARPLT